MTHLLNFMRTLDKPLSCSLRIAADMIEDNELDNYPEQRYEIDSVFVQLNRMIEEKQNEQMSNLQK